VKLRRYQERARDLMVANPYYALFVQPGLGKTITTIKALELIKGKTLIIAPIRVCETVWKQEAKVWDSFLTFSLIRGSVKERIEALKQNVDVYLINPELLPWLFTFAMQWDNLVVDESSMFKNPSSIRFKTLKKKLKTFKRRYILTGTPSPNSLLELWSQIGIIDFGARLGTSFSRFRETYFTSDYMGYTWTIKKGSKEKIEDLIKDIVLTLEAKDYLDLPDLIENNIQIEFPFKDKVIYKQFSKDMILETLKDGSITALNAVALHNKLSQLANGIVYNDQQQPVILHEHKFNALQELVEAISAPVMIVYRYIHEKNKIRKLWPDSVVFNEGNTNQHVEDWNNKKIKILLLHPLSGGHGINLQHGGNNIIWLAPTPSLEQHIQTNCRLHRSGQNEPVIVHTLIAKNTIDENILNILKNKNASQKSFLEAMKSLISLQD
jgi:SNF2 family DNA or RNA helicase